MLHNVLRVYSATKFGLGFKCLPNLKIVSKEDFDSSFEFKLLRFHHFNFEGKKCFVKDSTKFLPKQELMDFVEAVELNAKS